MLAINFNTFKNKFIKTRSPSFTKFTLSGLALASLLVIGFFPCFGCAADLQNQAPAPPEKTSASELLQNRPYGPDSVTSGKSLAYVKTDKLEIVGKLLTFTISATDADGGPLDYSVSNLPEGSSFDSDTRTFSWTPRYDQAGVYTVHFEVSDGELTDSEDITITVVQPYEDWDVNGDGAANVLDIVLVGQRWGEAGLTGWIREDTNEDGTVNVLDIITIGQHWSG
jgi:hypothetical protein